MLWRSRASPAALDADLVAVAPFDVLSPGLELWREGLVDLLARSLDGAGPLRTVSPTVVVRRWDGRADRSSAEALARRTGAGLVIYGSVVPESRDSVRVTAAVLDAGRAEAAAEAEVRGPADQLARLADSLALRLLAELGRARPLSAARSGGLTSRSLPAVRAFLRGEQWFRRTAWDSARASYERAVELDSTFALAYWRLGAIRGWQVSSGDSLAKAYYQLAGERNHGLPPRESLLIVFDSLKGTLDEGTLTDSASEQRVQRLLRTAGEATRRYPNDPESWVALGEAGVHFGAGRGVSYETTLSAFARAIALGFGLRSELHPCMAARSDPRRPPCGPPVCPGLAFARPRAERSARCADGHPHTRSASGERGGPPARYNSHARHVRRHHRLRRHRRLRGDGGRSRSGVRRRVAG